VSGPSRRVVLRDGVLVVVGAAACGTPFAPPVDDTGGGGGASGGDGGGDLDPCATPGGVGGAGWASVPLSSVSGLGSVGGGARVDLGGRRLALGRPAEDCVVAVSRVCTHEGCETAYDAGRFVCPCHGAVFDLDGSVVAGPTSVPVAAYPAVLQGDTVWIQLD
jgi:cytochrome b6-f complex iron-sulfur subunit